MCWTTTAIFCCSIFFLMEPLDEEEVSTVVRLAMQKAFPCLLADSLEVDLIRESVTEELLDSVPQSTQAMQDRLEDLLLGQEDFGVEQVLSRCCAVAAARGLFLKRCGRLCLPTFLPFLP